MHERVAGAWLRKVGMSDDLSEFRREVEGKRFRNPATGNDVLYVSLPRKEQAKIYAAWRRRRRGTEPAKERERGLIEINEDQAKSVAGHMADIASGWLVRDPDERIGDHFTPAMGRKHITAGTVMIRDVRGRRLERPVRLMLGEPTPDLWRSGRHYVTGGKVLTMHHGERDHGTPMSIDIKLNPDVTYADLKKGRSKVEREIYSVLTHELTHAGDVLMTPRQRARHWKKYPSEESASPQEQVDTKNRAYYNMPTEVRAFKRQVADEVRREMERRYKTRQFKKNLAEEKGEDFDDDPDWWIPMNADAVMGILDRSITWDRVRPYLTKKNRRKFLETVASVIRKFREDRGGRVAATWMRRAVSKEHVDRVRQVKVEDLPFDHLFEGRRRIVVDSDKYGGLKKSNRPLMAYRLHSFLIQNGALKEGHTPDWKDGTVKDENGRTVSKIGKAMTKAKKKFAGEDHAYLARLDKVLRKVKKNDSPTEILFGGNDYTMLMQLAAIGQLLEEDFPTDQVWKELKDYAHMGPSPETWDRLKKVADAFSELDVNGIDSLADSYAKKHADAEAALEKHPRWGYPLETKEYEQLSEQWRNGMNLLNSFHYAVRQVDRDRSMHKISRFVERVQEFFESEDSAPLRELHELGKDMTDEKFRKRQELKKVDQMQQDYARWRMLHNQDLSLVISRDPVDVLRMSDYPKAVQAIQSCHSEGGSYFECAVEEAEEGGLIAYVVNSDDLESVDLEADEVFRDRTRDVEGITPLTRLRLRRFEDSDMGTEVAVPELGVYGADPGGLRDVVTNWARDVQPDFFRGDHGFSRRPRDWKMTGGTYQDNKSSELFENFFAGSEGDKSSYDEPTEDEYDPYGEGYTVEDSPYYDPDREDEDAGEAEVGHKAVEPWREADDEPGFWKWMAEEHPEVRNPNPRGRKEHINPSTLKSYARGGGGSSSAARSLVERYLRMYRTDVVGNRNAPGTSDARPDIRQRARVARAWIRRIASLENFKEENFTDESSGESFKPKDYWKPLTKKPETEDEREYAKRNKKVRKEWKKREKRENSRQEDTRRAKAVLKFVAEARDLSQKIYGDDRLTSEALKLAKNPHNIGDIREEEDQYMYPVENREARRWALRHMIDRHGTGDIAEARWAADLFSENLRGSNKKEYERALEKMPLHDLVNNTPIPGPGSERKTDTEILYEDDRWRAEVPLSHKSMRKGGTDTAWCIATANPGHAMHYREKGWLHLFLIDKEAAKRGKSGRGKYAISGPDLDVSDVEVYDTYDDVGPGHLEDFERAFVSVTEKMGMPRKIADEIEGSYRDRHSDLKERMGRYPTSQQGRSFRLGLSSDILFGDLLGSMERSQLEDIASGDIFLSMEAQALTKLALEGHWNLRDEIDDTALANGIARAVPQRSAVLSNLSPEMIAKATGLPVDRCREVRDDLLPDLAVRMDRKSSKDRRGFREWLGKFEESGVPNPNPEIREPIKPSTLLEYASSEGYPYQFEAQGIKERFWNEFVQQNVEKGEENHVQLKNRNVVHRHPDAEISEEADIRHGALIGPKAKIKGGVVEGAVLSGTVNDGKISATGVVDGGTINGGEVRGLVRGGTVNDGVISATGVVNGGEVMTDAEIHGTVNDGKVHGYVTPSGTVNGGVLDHDGNLSGTLNGGYVGPDADVGGGVTINGGRWTEEVLTNMANDPRYEESFDDDAVLVRGTWDDVPEGVDDEDSESAGGSPER